MTSPDDYGSEMTASQQIDDATAEALLTGQCESDPLAWAIRACREAACWPLPRPSPELAALMTTGLPAPGRGRATSGRRGRVASAPPPAPRRARAPRSRRRAGATVVTGLSAAAARLAGLSLAAKASAGLAMVLAGVITAGVIGVLPGPAQAQFDTVVESVTGHRTSPPAEKSEFGRRVSEDARDGGVDGGVVREEARRQGEERGQLPGPAREHPVPRTVAPPAGPPADLPIPQPVPGPPHR